MGLFSQFIKNIKDRYLFTKNDRLLLAVSGGLDSVVLTALCRKAGFDFGIAHCNFQLRDAASDADELFVKNLSEQFDAPFFRIRFNTKDYALENKLSIQEAARELRYRWFEDIRKVEGFDYILTAHHANDNIETVLMNFFRGTGITGLTGIKEKNGALVRPLLFAKRKELEDYLSEENLSFVQDESNLKNDYTRNFIRNALFPQMAAIYPEVENNLAANIDRFKAADHLYREAIDRYKKKLAVQKGAELHIPILLLQKSVAPSTILFELIKVYGFSSGQLPEVERLMGSEPGHYVSSETHRVIRDRKHLVLAPLRGAEKTRVLIDGEGQYHFDGGHISILAAAYQGGKIPQEPNRAWLDAKEINFPMILRPWKTGDYFYPLGMEKKKKLSRFLIDTKRSLTEKENTWVVEMNKKIIWVVGQRIDNRFRITDQTKNIIEISCNE
ncbi:MAG: tRNA lysidine(34) synthetase TilS [Niabella sp.]|nr:tRNA lysidine(34) synthetase TilS [Niabella sp.]